jgi:RNA polymerase sigma factor for flagellar operon FliA
VREKGSHDIDSEPTVCGRAAAPGTAPRATRSSSVTCRRIARGTKVLPTAALGRDDLEAAGIVGLIQAIDRFAPERGIPFEGYAALRVRGAPSMRYASWTT